MTPISAIILDFDGVILESNGLKTVAFATVFGRFPAHAAAMMAHHHEHVSLTRFAKFRHMAERLGAADPDAFIEECAGAFSSEMLRQIAACPLVPGALEFLARAAGAVPVFLASVTPQEELDEILRRRELTAYFTRVYGCPPWTKAGAIGEILSQVASPEAAVFVGDSAGDQRAARQTGVAFLARDSGLPFDDPQPVTYPDMFAVADAIIPRLPTRVHTGELP